ncbi:MAG: amidohydrolase family protein [Planctomycetes bacterium]|nr:amidohydrolase family protein [Planctomycetota bacterium]
MLGVGHTTADPRLPSALCGAALAVFLCACAAGGTSASERERERELAARAGGRLASPPEGVQIPLAGEGQRFALRAAKVLTVEHSGRGFVDDGIVVVKDGRIEAVGPASETPVPEGYPLVDLGTRWVMPGMVDLHTHVAGSESANDINDMVLQTNEGLRASCAVLPGTELLKRELSAGVTTVLFIPGSGTNIGGQGVLLKTGLDQYESMRVRDPGSLKIAQGDNPTRWGYGMGRGMMNYHIRTQVRKGLAYAKSWREHEQGRGARPEIDPQFEVFRALFEKDTQISTHTQIYQLVLTTMTMLKGEFDLDVYIDHGEWRGYLATPVALRLGVNAICGPREIDSPAPPRVDTDGRIESVSAGYQSRGMTEVGFNTDAPVVPGEELALQATMGVRYGFRGDRMEAVRGLTIVPARTAGIAHRVGSIEVGKDADLVVIGGDPADPRHGVECVFIEGLKVYDVEEGRRW